MTSSLPDLILANIDGQTQAREVLQGLRRHYSDPDSLYLALKHLMPVTRDVAQLAKLRGFLRVLQKSLEA